MEKKIKVTIPRVLLAFALVLLFVYILTWKYFSRISEVKILRGLKNNQSIISYTGHATLDPNDINVAFYDDDFDSLGKGDIFWAHNGANIDVVLVSPDTVLIKPGFYSDMYKYVDNARGIVFKYDFETDPRKKKEE